METESPATVYMALVRAALVLVLRELWDQYR